MVVYIEYVLIDNFFIDYMLLKTTFVLTGSKAGRGRFLVCSFLGAVIALLLPLVRVKGILLAIIKLLSGLLLVCICVKEKSAKALYKNFAVFLFLTALTGGAIIGVFSIFSITYSSEICIAIMIAPVYLIVKVFRGILNYLSNKTREKTLYKKVILTLGNRSVEGIGFLDTGNALYDQCNPVIVCGKAFALKLMGEEFFKIKLKKISVRTVSGSEQNYAFLLDKILIYNGDKPNIHNNVTVCISKGGVGDGYDVILHPRLMEVENASKSGFEVKEVS